MSNVFNILTYWRNSLADAEYMSIDSSKLENAVLVKRNEVKSGKINQEKTEQIFEKAKELRKKQEKSLDNFKSENENNDVSLREKEQSNENEVEEILICPIVAFLEKRHGVENKNLEKIISPLYIPAIVNTKGELELKTDAAPWIPRDYLEPVRSQKITPLGSIDEFDDFLSGRSMPGPEEGWTAYWKYCDDMLKHVTKKSIDEFDLEGYKINSDAFILVEEKNQKISYNLISLYDDILRSKCINKLLARYADIEDKKLENLLTEEEEILICSEHLGQMSPGFSLSSSQRQSVHHFFTLKDGEILAVNGPPGTGKTTLLHSIIASLWVKAALNEEEPPVIVAVSANNQAVTNIIDSFAKMDEIEREKNVLEEWWLSDIKSYGLFLPASNKLKEAEKKYQVIDNQGGGFEKIINNGDYVKENRNAFIGKCSKYAGKSFKDLRECRRFLHGLLKETVGEIKRGVDIYKRLKKQREVIEDNYREYGGVDEFIKENQSKIMKIEEEIKTIVNVIEGWVKHIQSAPWWMNIFYFLPWVKQRILWRNEEYNSRTNYRIDADLSSNSSIMNFLRRKKEELVSEKKLKKDILNRAMKEKSKLMDLRAELKKWAEKNEIKLDKEPQNLYEFLGPIDPVLRYRAFKLATHYWECRWLEEMEAALDKTGSSSFTEEALKKRWKRLAKLTPCFVSTLFTLPRFFRVNEGSQSGKNYLYDFIDLLIVDEAGQISPEVAGAVFALARKALVVGDILQIEPVWNIMKEVDKANMIRYKVISKMDEKEIKDFINKGMAASCGCVMKIAQRASKYKVFEERGMFLTEHRRCYESIIKYCNELAYKGRLLPMRPNPEGELILPLMGYKLIKGKAKKYMGSWGNDIEAEEIAKWIYENRELLEVYYSKKENTSKNIMEIIGIVTPFTYQSRIIKERLEKYRLSGITVGTVHSLQGAERNIVIFSPVYDSRYKGWDFFFDRNINMLNVAVSRAKDSFLVFGDIEIFDEMTEKPSGLLAKYIKKGGEVPTRIDSAV